MKSFRVIGISTSVALVAALALGQSPLDRRPKPGNGNGSPPPQSGPKPDNNKPSGPPPSRPDQGPRPGGGQSGPKPDNDRPRPKPDNPKPDQGPPPGFDRPRPKPDNPKPDQGPPPGFDRPRPKPDNEKPQPMPDLGRPRPKPDNDKPGDDFLKPRPQPGGGNPGGGPGNDDRKPDIGRQPQPRQGPGGSWGQDSPIGRINNGGGRPNQGPRDGMLGRQGGNNYGGSISNGNKGDNRGQRPEIGRAPIDIFRGGLQGQVRREDQVRYANRWRTGYYHYRRDWCDDNFWFNWYVFDPFRANCYVSPWYYYPHLPGYVNYRCVTVLNISLSPWYGTVYNWYRPSNWNDYRSNSDLDYALEDLTRAFERADTRALRRLLPYRDRIAIFVDGQYNYSMTSDDFADFMIDAIEGTDTRRYEIVRVERRGREAEVQARHDYIDPYGNRETVYHTYRLEEDRGSYVITRFGTSYYR